MRFDGLRDLREQLIVGPGLGDVIQCATFESGPRHIEGAVSGDEYYGKTGIATADLFQEIETVAVWKTDVEKQQVKGALLQPGQTGLTGFRAGDAIAFAGEQEFEALAYFRFVVDHQDRALMHGLLS